MLEEAIVQPVAGPGTPRPGTVALLAATQTDLALIRTLLPLDTGCTRALLLSRLYFDLPDMPGLCVCGPLVGAPYAVMLLESLVAWGVRTVLFVGWCGAIAPQARIGSLIVPDGAMIDEGTSRHYVAGVLPEDAVSHPSEYVRQGLQQALQTHNRPFLQGPVWSTDAIYRETPSRVRHYQARGALAVEMELSALFSVAAFRNIDLGGLLVVSDELFTLNWKPGFRHPEFKAGCRTACEVAVAYVRGVGSDGGDSPADHHHG